ncbi:MAG: hypothetical protein Q8S00_18615 [Deltaproteobacteria bacterium]|nr:hypothetical protein [Deltaproteobacteria bacterium]MDZ4346910.1 hypothetical protein [Candidatus Binatia bacterium]
MNEMQRRISILEKKIQVGSRCAHPLAVLRNPSETELEAAREIINACPRCRLPGIGRGPSVIVIEFPQG